MVFQLTIFGQLMELLEHRDLARCVEKYAGNERVRSFSCLDQFLCMVFAQLGEKKSMRATVFSLQQMRHKLYPMGIRGRVSLSALSDANNSRDWQIWRDYAQSLIPQARALYISEKLSVDEEISNTVYAFDSSPVDLFLSVLGWAHFRRTKAGIKMHTQLDLRGAIPVYINITDAKVNDVNALDWLVFELGAIRQQSTPRNSCPYWILNGTLMTLKTE